MTLAVPSAVPMGRVRQVGAAPLRADRELVLYWMTAARRTRHNFGLQRAVEHANELKKPLLVFEPLRCGYEYASDRLHTFVIEGMAANARACEGKPVRYWPFVEEHAGQGQGLLARLAGRACVVVTDEYPTFFLPQMLAAAGRALDVRLEAVDSLGLLPLSSSPKHFSRAFDFRRFVQRTLTDHLDPFPLAEPLAALPSDLPVPAAPKGRDLLSELADPERLVRDLPIRHDIRPAPVQGGAEQAGAVLERFVDLGLGSYGDRNHPDKEVESGLSPYLHFGHVSAHEVFARVIEGTDWSPDDLGDTATGQREGWWGLDEAREGFLDQLVTWRELGQHFAWHRPDHASYDSLPGWALTTLEEHARDPREELYTLEELEQANTSDPLWNAAQRQLVGEGRIHNYMRMLWGKKVLGWTASPREAWSILVELNDRYALDGRDPNSYSGIGWIFGRFDRAWGPERRVFGKIRYMTSDSTRRKLKLKAYLERWGETLFSAR